MSLSPKISSISISRPTSAVNLQYLLSQPAQRAAFRHWFSVKFICIQALIKSSVSGSTFRAYRTNVTYTPSSLFRTWAQNFPSSTHMASLVGATSRPWFDAFHNAAADDFLNYWNTQDCYQSLNWGQSRKLFDLFIKHLALWDQLNPIARKNILSFGRVPLDRYTLGFASLIATSTPPLNSHKNWTMGFVTSSVVYNNVQLDIEKSVGKFSPLAFDILAWNTMHPGPTASFVARGAGGACSAGFSLVKK